MLVTIADILNALVVNGVHSCKCDSLGMTKRAAKHHKVKCTCWVEAEEIVVNVEGD